MFFWFGFPFLFILPLFVAAIAVRAGAHLFRSMDNSDRRYMSGYGRDSTDLLNELYGAPRNGRSPEARIFQLARKLGGKLTVSDVVIELGVDVGQAEELLQGLVDNVRVRMEVNEDGRVTFEFPEIIDRYEQGNA